MASIAQCNKILISSVNMFLA